MELREPKAGEKVNVYFVAGTAGAQMAVDGPFECTVQHTLNAHSIGTVIEREKRTPERRSSLCKYGTATFAVGGAFWVFPDEEPDDGRWVNGSTQHAADERQEMKRRRKHGVLADQAAAQAEATETAATTEADEEPAAAPPESEKPDYLDPEA